MTQPDTVVLVANGVLKEHLHVQIARYLSMVMPYFVELGYTLLVASNNIEDDEARFIYGLLRTIKNMPALMLHRIRRRFPT